MYQSIGDTSKMTELLSAAKTLMDEMEDKCTSLSKLKAIKQSTEVVDAYIKKGSAAVGINVSNKKRKNGDEQLCSICHV